MATGGTPFDDCADEQELHNWTVTNGSSLEDRLNNMVQRRRERQWLRPKRNPIPYVVQCTTFDQSPMGPGRK